MSPMFPRPYGWFGAALLWAVAAASGAAAERPAPDLEAGRAAYLASCARCHGAAGQGDGVDAKRFYPRPRDLTLGVYKFRSTASGTPPTDEDLFRTISHGLPGSNMPDWQHLDEATRWQLVFYLKSLSPVFAQSEPMLVALTRDPGRTRANLAKGRAVYEQLGCAACHGSAGRADGTSAAGLIDDRGMAIRPANLTHGWSYRGGHTPQDIVVRMLTGIDGAGMPSYAEAVSPEDAWHLAYYVASLQEPARWHPVLRSAYFAQPAPSQLTDPRWLLAERADVRLRNAVTPDGQWNEPPTIRAVSMQAIHTDEALAVRLSWDDPTKELDPPLDGLALLFKPAGGEGDVVTLQAWPAARTRPLDICYWSADNNPIIEQVATQWQNVQARQEPAPVTLTGAVEYREGQWSLVVQRPLQPTAPAGAASLAVGSLASVAVAVWDGGNPAARAISPWIDVDLTAKEAHR
jgi:cytochrome c oxidase cbb3-type subunit 2